MAKKSARATRPKGDASNPPATAASDAKRDRPANPLATDPEIHPAIRPLFDALVMVAVWSKQIAGCYAEMVAMRDARGLPKPDDWPGSPARKADQAIRDKWPGVTVVEPAWTEMIRRWADLYRPWCDALAEAKKRAQSPAVATIMDGGESRPAERWTARVVIDLDKLAGLLHPIRVGGVDGLGFVRHGLPPLPPEFADRAVAVCARIDELRAVPASLGVPGDAPGTPTKPKPNRRKRQMKWLAEAMLTVRDHPEWSDAAIAQQVGIDKSRLSRSPEYRKAAALAREPNKPAGWVKVADGLGKLEAVDDSFDPNRRPSRQWQEEEDVDDRIDREMRETQRGTQRNSTKSPQNRRSGGT
jgi:hypothetical protein